MEEREGLHGFGVQMDRVDQHPPLDGCNLFYLDLSGFALNTIMVFAISFCLCRQKKAAMEILW